MLSELIDCCHQKQYKTNFALYCLRFNVIIKSSLNNEYILISVHHIFEKYSYAEYDTYYIIFLKAQVLGV